MTNAIEKAGRLLQINLLDHIIIGDNNYLSINAYKERNNS